MEVLTTLIRHIFEFGAKQLALCAKALPFPLTRTYEKAPARKPLPFVVWIEG